MMQRGDPDHTAADSDVERSEDERASGTPDEQGEAEPTPGEDQGPFGNPAQDEEALRHEQEEQAER